MVLQVCGTESMQCCRYDYEVIVRLVGWASEVVRCVCVQVCAKSNGCILSGESGVVQCTCIRWR